MSLLPVYPVIAPKTRFQPVYVRDLAQAIAAAALDPRRHAGKTYEIAGPEVVTMRQLTENIAATAGQSPSLVDLPDFAADALSYLGFLPGAPLTRDQWLMLQTDNVAGKKAPGLAAFGITPTPMAAVADEWLARFREGGRFAARRETALGQLSACPPARHHPRHRRGGHRISAGFLDRASDPGDRADGL